MARGSDDVPCCLLEMEKEKEEQKEKGKEKKEEESGRRGKIRDQWDLKSL